MLGITVTMHTVIYTGPVQICSSVRPQWHVPQSDISNFKTINSDHPKQV